VSPPHRRASESTNVDAGPRTCHSERLWPKSAAHNMCDINDLAVYVMQSVARNLLLPFFIRQADSSSVAAATLGMITRETNPVVGAAQANQWLDSRVKKRAPVYLEILLCSEDFEGVNLSSEG